MIRNKLLVAACCVLLASCGKSEMVDIGNGIELKRSVIEQYASDEGISYDEAIDRFETMAAFKKAIEKVRKDNS